MNDEDPGSVFVEEPKIRQSEQINELVGALAMAQGEMTGAKKEAFNPHFKNKYADLDSVWDACRAPLAKNGLAVLQPVSSFGAKVTITTMLAHKSGQWIASDLEMQSAQATPQVIGSMITYGRRYGLAAMVGVASADDDGNAASGKPQKEPTWVPEPPPPTRSALRPAPPRDWPEEPPVVQQLWKQMDTPRAAANALVQLAREFSAARKDGSFGEILHEWQLDQEDDLLANIKRAGGDAARGAGRDAVLLLERLREEKADETTDGWDELVSVDDAETKQLLREDLAK